MNKWMIAGVALSFLLASCSKDDDNTPQSGNNTNVNGGAVVSFSSNIFASVVVEVTGPGTRAPITAFEPNAQLGVLVFLPYRVIIIATVTCSIKKRE